MARGPRADHYIASVQGIFASAQSGGDLIRVL